VFLLFYHRKQEENKEEGMRGWWVRVSLGFR